MESGTNFIHWLTRATALAFFYAHFPPLSCIFTPKFTPTTKAKYTLMAKIEITQPASGGGGTVNTGVLQIAGGGPITNSSQRITDQSGNTSPLYISSTALTVTTPTSASAITRVIIQGSTDSAGYILRAVNRTGSEIFNIKDDGSVLSTGPLTISTIANATTDTDKFLVSDAGVIKYRTGAELLSDLGFTGAPVYGGGTATRLAYWSGTVGASSSTLTSSANLFWDAVNSRLGVNTATPTQSIDVAGTTKTTSLIISTATAQSTTATQYLSLDAADSTVKYRTPAQVLSDIGAQATLTNPVTGTGTATRVAFWSSASAISSSSALYWDDTNSRLGINTTTPTGKLSIVGVGTTTGVNIAVQNSALTTIFGILDSGVIELRTSGVATSLAIGIGAGGLTGANSTFVGRNSGGSTTSLSSDNTFFGHNSGAATTGSALRNVFVGGGTGAANTSGSSNSYFGYQSGLSNTASSFNSGVGAFSIGSASSGSNNSGVGYSSGQYITGGVTANATCNNSVFLGALTKAAASSQTNQIVIGYDTTGNGSNTATIGNSSVTDTYLAGNINISDAKNIVVGATTGTKIATSTSQKIGLWNAAPIAQPTSLIIAATFASVGGSPVLSSSTFDGYSIGQVVAALRSFGLLA